MITLYDNPFSPFARKVRLVLGYKEIPFESIDALAKEHHGDFSRANPRAEVPVLDDEGFTVSNSSEIVAYLEDRYPEPPVLPVDPKERANARYWERLADSFVDAVIHDISIWMWPTHQRQDEAPEGLLEAGRRDLEELVSTMESSLHEDGFLCGAVTVADFALFPHLSALKPLGMVIDRVKQPRVYSWFRRMRSLPTVRNDLDYVKRMATEKFFEGPSPYEGEKIIWRGDRLEWLFANGFHGWWLRELEEGRAVVPSWLSSARGAHSRR